MKASVSPEGTWTGRLVDLQGFEGEITLRLDEWQKDGSVSGSFDVAIGGHHASVRSRGGVRGKLSNDHLTLQLQLGDEFPARIVVDGHMWRLKSGGAGLCATYEVASKVFSPLQGGAIALNSNIPPTASRVSRTGISSTDNGHSMPAKRLKSRRARASK